VREFLALPFYLLAKAFAYIADKIDDKPVFCFSDREAEELK